MDGVHTRGDELGILSFHLLKLALRPQNFEPAVLDESICSMCSYTNETLYRYLQQIWPRNAAIGESTGITLIFHIRRDRLPILTSLRLRQAMLAANMVAEPSPQMVSPYIPF